MKFSGYLAATIAAVVTAIVAERIQFGHVFFFSLQALKLPCVAALFVSYGLSQEGRIENGYVSAALFGGLFTAIFFTLILLVAQLTAAGYHVGGLHVSPLFLPVLWSFIIGAVAGLGYRFVVCVEQKQQRGGKSSIQ